MHEDECYCVRVATSCSIENFNAYSSLHCYCQNWPEQDCTTDAGQTHCGNLDIASHPTTPKQVLYPA